MDKEEFRARIAIMIDGMTTQAEIAKALRMDRIPFENDSKNAGTLSFRIPRPWGMTRIFRRYKSNEIVVWNYEYETFEWSGIPVFEPSGRHSF